MLKRISIRKILVASSALFALLLICLIPTDQPNQLQNQLKQELEYVNKEAITATIFLQDSQNMLAMTEVIVQNSNQEIEAKAKELIEYLIKGGPNESKIPNGFKAIIPSETKINAVKYENNLLKIDLSKEALEVEEEQEEKIIEAIVYTLTTIPDIKNIIIYIDGDILTKLPKSKINLPSTLDRSFGINKQYDIKSTKDITSVTTYYVNKFNDNYYYVPVTKVLNDERDKIKIIIEDLTSSPIYNSNLMSFLNNNTKLIAANEENDILTLEFNEFIFNDIDTQNILEEVIYTICLSVADNYDVKEVIFEVENKELYKSVLKTIE